MSFGGRAGEGYLGVWTALRPLPPSVLLSLVPLDSVANTSRARQAAYCIDIYSSEYVPSPERRPVWQRGREQLGQLNLELNGALLIYSYSVATS